MPNDIDADIAVITDRQLIEEYQRDRGAIRRLAKNHGLHITTLYRRMNRLGVPRRRGGDANRGTQAMNKNPNWKGGRHVDTDGYVSINIGGRQVYEHRFVMEQKLGRKLRHGEVVHHINGDRGDNRIGNLKLYKSHAEHMAHHMTSSEAANLGRIAHTRASREREAGNRSFFCVAEHTIDVLRETQCPWVQYGDTRLLHMIAERCGYESDGIATEVRILGALSKRPGRLIKSIVRVSGRSVRRFSLPSALAALAEEGGRDE